MQEKSLEEIKENAKEIMKNSTIKVLSGEKEIIEQLKKIIAEDCKEVDVNTLSKILDYIKIYIEMKERMMFAKEDYEYLKFLAQDLNEQSVRRTDGILYVPLFKVMRKNGNEKYFLTRKSAQEYISVNVESVVNKIIEIEENDNTDLGKLIEIIKRNF